MNLATSRLNNQVLCIEEAETEIRLAVKNAFFIGINQFNLNGQIKKIIEKALSKIRIRDLKSATYRSLLNFYYRQYREWQRLNSERDVFLALVLLNNKTPAKTSINSLQAVNILQNNGIKTFGVPLQEYSENYFKNKVKPIYENLIKQQPLDPDDVRDNIKQRNTLRNRAEMEVRYQGNKDSLADFIAKGVELVVASSHADCSERCREWQGKVYSLDGTSGITDDGRPYQPIENAINVPYITKAGKVYMNGLLGFNCRHYIVAYKTGVRFPKVSEALERKEYEITEKQRYMEKQIRNLKTEAIYFKGVDNKAYKEAKSKANDWYEKYMQFSKENNRAYYPARTKILNNEKDYIEYNKFINILGKNNVPENIDKFKEIKYNNKNSYKDLQETVARQFLTKEILSGKYSLIVEEGKQLKHFKSSNNYISNKSYLTIDFSQVQDIVNKNAGFGKMEQIGNGIIGNKELIELDKNVGFVKDIFGEWQPTNRVKIHYSKKGVHIVPTLKEMWNDSEKTKTSWRFKGLLVKKH